MSFVNAIASGGVWIDVFLPYDLADLYQEGTGKEANEQSPEEAHEESASPGDNTSEDGEVC